jgi:hypothetical protein
MRPALPYSRSFCLAGLDGAALPHAGWLLGPGWPVGLGLGGWGRSIAGKGSAEQQERCRRLFSAGRRRYSGRLPSWDVWQMLARISLHRDTNQSLESTGSLQTGRFSALCLAVKGSLGQGLAHTCLLKQRYKPGGPWCKNQIFSVRHLVRQRARRERIQKGGRTQNTTQIRVLTTKSEPFQAALGTIVVRAGASSRPILRANAHEKSDLPSSRNL